MALYAITDVALVTSLRDGMNLGGWDCRSWFVERPKSSGECLAQSGILGMRRACLQTSNARPALRVSSYIPGVVSLFLPVSLLPAVSYEYVACQRDNAGVLILSEFAGAAQSLGKVLCSAVVVL